jgi:hypothetical protein
MSLLTCPRLDEMEAIITIFGQEKYFVFVGDPLSIYGMFVYLETTGDMIESRDLFIESKHYRNPVWQVPPILWDRYVWAICSGKSIAVVEIPDN